jgi:hypothetical protein
VAFAMLFAGIVLLFAAIALLNAVFALSFARFALLTAGIALLLVVIALLVTVFAFYGSDIWRGVVYPIEQIFFVILNFKLLEEFKIFFFECFVAMMLFLISDILIYIIKLRMSIRECAISFLPAKFAFDPLLLIDKIG